MGDLGSGCRDGEKLIWLFRNYYDRVQHDFLLLSLLFLFPGFSTALEAGADRDFEESVAQLRDFG